MARLEHIREQGRRVRSRLRDEGQHAREMAKDTLPFLITGGAGDDPAGVVTYTMVGATTGFSQLWLLLISTPMLAAANSMAARITVATNEGLAAVLKERYGRAVSFIVVLVLAIANTITIAADMAGVAAVLGMLTGVHWTLYIPVIMVILVLILHTGYSFVKRILGGFTLVLLSYLLSAFMSRPDWEEVVRSTLIPHLISNSTWIIAAIGLLGTTISPYLLFWQAGEEIEELHEHVRIQPTFKTTSVWIGMIYSNMIAFFIIVAAASTLYLFHIPVETVADAARALAPLGRVGWMAFIIGVISSGLLALPVLAGSTAYAVAEIFNWPEGLGVRVAQARGFYLVLVGGLFGGGLIALLPRFHPVDALYYSQVLDGLLLPVLMALLLALSNDPRIVGDMRNPRWINVTAGLTILITLIADIYVLSS